METMYTRPWEVEVSEHTSVTEHGSPTGLHLHAAEREGLVVHSVK